MVSYKNCFYALSIMLTLLSGQFIQSATQGTQLGEQQARKYINHLLDSLFVPHTHSIPYQQHLGNFSQALTNNLMKNLGKFPAFYSFSKVYNDHEIYQEVLNASLMFIEKCARNCAINEIQQYYTEITGNQKTFVDKIVSLLTKELKTKIGKSFELPQGIFIPYFGTALANRVHDLVTKELKKEANRLEKLKAKLCSTCSLKFDTSTHKKVTLSCNHTVCFSCLKYLWNKLRIAIACPECNTRINIRDHVPGAWVTPTPDSHYYSTN